LEGKLWKPLIFPCNIHCQGISVLSATPQDLEARGKAAGPHEPSFCSDVALGTDGPSNMPPSKNQPL